MAHLSTLPAARSLIPSGSNGWRSLVTVALTAFRGLAAMHECNYVHVDLKPPNILICVEDGEVVSKV